MMPLQLYKMQLHSQLILTLGEVDVNKQQNADILNVKSMSYFSLCAMFSSLESLLTVSEGRISALSASLLSVVY